MEAGDHPAEEAPAEAEDHPVEEVPVEAGAHPAEEVLAEAEDRLAEEIPVETVHLKAYLLLNELVHQRDINIIILKGCPDGPDSLSICDGYGMFCR